MSREKVEKLLLEHLREPSKEKEPLVTACLALYMNVIGDEVAEAISPLSELSAPFIAATLEHYAKVIRNNYGCDNRFVEGLKAFVAGKEFLPKAPPKKPKAVGKPKDLNEVPKVDNKKAGK